MGRHSVIKTRPRRTTKPGGRRMTRALKVLAKSAPGALRHRSQPTWIPPMLATLADALPTQGKWIYEPKLDGVRGLVYVTGGTVRIFSRNRKPLNGAYP